MARARRLIPSPAMAGAMAALIVAVGGQAAYAAAANFLLNTINTGTAQTTLSGSGIAGRALQITNTNTGAGATALGLNVASGHTPFTVNSTTKVAKLNADLLDGINSTGFVQGTGSTYGTRWPCSRAVRWSHSPSAPPDCKSAVLLGRPSSSR
ncbi:MAG: hypothetical protein ACTHNU_02795 [Gaiellales bacterium]